MKNRTAYNNISRSEAASNAAVLCTHGHTPNHYIHELKLLAALPMKLHCMKLVCGRRRGMAVAGVNDVMI